MHFCYFPRQSNSLNSNHYTVSCVSSQPITDQMLQQHQRLLYLPSLACVFWWTDTRSMARRGRCFRCTQNHIQTPVLHSSISRCIFDKQSLRNTDQPALLHFPLATVHSAVLMVQVEGMQRNNGNPPRHVLGELRHSPGPTSIA